MNELLRRVIHSGALCDRNPELEAEICEHLKRVDHVQLIIAGSSRQAAHIAKVKGVNRYIYLSCGQGLNGAMRGGTIWLYGTYYSLPGWRMLRDMAKAYGYELVEIAE